MRIVERGILCEGVAGTARAVATFPSATVLGDGTVLGVYRVGRTKDSKDSVTEVRRSNDGGRTWREPEQLFETSFGGVGGSLQVVYLTALAGHRVMACALWVDQEAFPGQPLFNAETEGCLPMKILVADSSGDARSFSPWREVAVTEDVGPPSLTSPVFRLPSGKLVVSIETNKPYLDRSPWLQRVVYCESFDGGATWTLPRTVCQDPTGRIFHWDQRVGVALDGTLAAFSWTYDKPKNRYLPIRRHVSRDEGLTWSTDELGFADQAAHPAILPDGRTALAWVDRYGSRSIRARMAASVDGSFDPETEVVIHEAGGAAATTSDTGEMLADMGLWTFGLPYGEALPDGSALIVYYAGTPEAMDVRWARLEL